MKRTLLLSGALVCTATTMAQITVNSSNIVDAGGSVVVASDTLPTVTPGGSGASQTWDFTNVVAHDIRTMDYVVPASTPYPSAFPSASMAVDEGGNFAYFQKTASALEMHGLVGDLFGSGSSDTVAFNPPDVLMHFPVNFNDSHSDPVFMEFKADGSSLGVDSIWVKREGTRTSDVDGWGSVTTPTGTFDALRVHQVETTTDSVWVYIGFVGWNNIAGDVSVAHSYQWLTDAATENWPVVTMRLDSSNTVVESVEFTYDPALSISEGELASGLAYPNPAASKVSFGRTEGSLTITDANGRLVAVHQLSQEPLDVSDLENGIYLYSIEDDGEIHNGRFTVQH